jgi:hypothetical protein
VVFSRESTADGWSLILREGAYVFTEIRVERRGAALCVIATISDRIDGLAPGMRGRMIFDLRADLVALG